MKHVKRFFFIIIFCFGVYFLYRNREVGVHVFRVDLGIPPFYKEVWEVYNAAIIAVSFLLGGLIFFLVGFFSRASRNSDLKRSKETIKNLEEKVGKLEMELKQAKSSKNEEQTFGQGMFKAPR